MSDGTTGDEPEMVEVIRMAFDAFVPVDQPRDGGSIGGVGEHVARWGRRLRGQGDGIAGG